MSVEVEMLWVGWSAEMFWEEVRYVGSGRRFIYRKLLLELSECLLSLSVEVEMLWVGWSAEMFWEEVCGEWEEVYIP
jgi:hypothetical protein